MDESGAHDVEEGSVDVFRETHHCPPTTVVRVLGSAFSLVLTIGSDATQNFSFNLLFKKMLPGGAHARSVETSSFQSFQCVPIAARGFVPGAYKCVCARGYYFPVVKLPPEEKYFSGDDLERFQVNSSSNGSDADLGLTSFQCIQCAEVLCSQK